MADGGYDAIRKMVVSGHNISGLVLSPAQLKLYNLAKSKTPGYITSSFVSKRFSISVQSAAVRLKKLADAGYLEREPMSDKSGGLLFGYYARVWK